MFGQTHYVPILKGRGGEYGALQSLSNQVRDALTPLLEVPPIPWDFEEETPVRTIDIHLAKVAQKVERAWGGTRSLFIDLLWISEMERMSDGMHPLTFVFSSTRDRGIKAVPVVGLLRGADYLNACRAIVAEDQRGICLRVQREDFIDFDDLAGAIDETLRRLRVESADTDLLLDLRALDAGKQPLNAGDVVGLIRRLPAVSSWRTLTLAATSFPQNLIGLPPSDSSLLPRNEWALWRAIRRERLDRIPTFSDYGISHPEPAEVDPRIMRPSASIRYTCDGAWLVMKARNLRDHGYEQFHEVCRELVRRQEFSGCTFSWGDTYVDDCAAERVGTGNLTTWRKVGTSHHLSFVVQDLANHLGS
jgi:hypothetical protein